MSDDIVITSTTDPPEAVAAAAGVDADKKPADAGQPAEAAPSEAPSKEEAESADAPETSEGPQEKREATEETPPEPEEKRQQKAGFQKRIDRLTRDKREAEERAQRLEQELAAARKPLEPQSPPAAESKPAQPDPDKEPTEDDYPDDWGAYNRALVRWETRQATQAAIAEAETKRKADEARQTAVDRVNKSFDLARKKHADFDEVLEGSSDIKLAESLTPVILDSEVSGEIIYHLAKNPAEHQRIAAMEPYAAMRAIGALEQQLLSDKTSSPVTTNRASSAPTPITPVESGSSGTTKKPDEMNYQEYKRWREASGAAPN